MNEFETVANEIENKKLTNEVSQEFAIEWVKGSDTATVTFPGGSRYTSKLKKLAKEYPEEVKIRKENKDKSIVGTIPVKYIKISHPRKVEFTDEQKEILAKRLRDSKK